MKWTAYLFILLLLAGCRDQILNSPYSDSDSKANIVYSVFATPPKTLDPARSFEEGESTFTGQIYEPPLQYHYLRRPYQLEPLIATELPKVIYLDAQGKRLADLATDKQVAYSVYNIAIRPGIYYQPHPAFVQDQKGNYVYHHLSAEQLKKIRKLSDFTHTGTRELTAEDYVYEIKRLASPKTQSPILGLMAEHIVDLDDYTKRLRKEFKKSKKNNESHFFDLRLYPLKGVDVIDRYHYRITLHGKYSQFIYWLAMPFFAPIPWEADAFYSQPGFQQYNINFDWFPVGTGAYMLVENNPNWRMVLEKNPNFHPEFYPSEGNEGDKEKGYLTESGQRLPFVNRFEFYLEKEALPRWNKFLQGYYDSSGIAADNFDEAVYIDNAGKPILKKALKKKDIQLRISVDPAVYYLGFNMLDNVVGGYSEQARKLRQAIGIAMDDSEYITIFANGRGLLAHRPIPPEIFGYQSGADGINKMLYEWQDGKAKKKSLAYAKQLMIEAGYADGRDQQGKPLVLNYDAVTTNDPSERSHLDWLRKQFAKLGIQLNIEATTYNRFQQKMRDGNSQIFSWGWIADYPDPENFLFLFYSANGKVQFGGENAANYSNKQYDTWYEQMRNMPNTPQRLAIIDKMVNKINEDAPVLWSYYPTIFTLAHEWQTLRKPAAIGRNYLKYIKIDPAKRVEKQQQWNKAIIWPVILSAILLLALIIYIVFRYKHQQRKAINDKVL